MDTGASKDAVKGFCMTVRKVLLLFILMFPLASLAHAQGKLNVVTSTEDLAAIATEVGGDRISVESIARGYQDPHFVEAKPSFILKMQKADLLIVVGRELEIGWLPPLITQSRNAKVQVGGSGYLDASMQARILDLPTGQVTRAMGDVHPLGNPHYWLDPENGKLIAKTTRIWPISSLVGVMSQVPLPAQRRRRVRSSTAEPSRKQCASGARSACLTNLANQRGRRSQEMRGAPRPSPSELQVGRPGQHSQAEGRVSTGTDFSTALAALSRRTTGPGRRRVPLRRQASHAVRS